MNRLLIALLLCGACQAQAQIPVLGSRLELFVDHYLIDQLTDTEFKLHAPQRTGVAVRFDKPWEGAFAGYVTVIKDADRYRMYYRGLPRAGLDCTAIESTCYAESVDGITWTKPELGIFEIDGSRANNVILKGHEPASHNFSPFLDQNPRAQKSARFKALGGSSKGLVPFGSADGIHWKPLHKTPVITDGVFDSQNVAFWSTTENCYVCYLRTWDSHRSVSRATSKDFLHWSKSTPMTYGGTPREHLYTNQTHPYFRAPHIYLGIAARFMPGRRILTPSQAKAIQVNPNYAGDCSDAVLLSTRGGSSYSRTFMEALIRPGPGLENWVSRTNYPALGILPVDNKLAIFVQKNYGQPSAQLDRYALRIDGFTSVHASYKGGYMVTKPFRLQEPKNSAKDEPETPAITQLLINFATSAAGSIRVEIQNADGEALPGFQLEDCLDIVGDEIARPVRWRTEHKLSSLGSSPIRLRFALKDADLYSLQFHK